MSYAAPRPPPKKAKKGAAAEKPQRRLSATVPESEDKNFVIALVDFDEFPDETPEEGSTQGLTNAEILELEKQRHEERPHGKGFVVKSKYGSDRVLSGGGHFTDRPLPSGVPPPTKQPSTAGEASLEGSNRKDLQPPSSLPLVYTSASRPDLVLSRQQFLILQDAIQHKEERQAADRAEKAKETELIEKWHDGRSSHVGGLAQGLTVGRSDGVQYQLLAS